MCENIRWLNEEVSIIIVSAKQTDLDKVKGLIIIPENNRVILEENRISIICEWKHIK